MDPYDFVMLGLLAAGGEMKGKTRLQKTMYFLGELANCLDDLGYRPHFYGPYSQAVADAVDRMKVLQFVDQDIRGGGAVDQSGFEVCRYDYRLNEDGRKIAEQKKKRMPKLWGRLERAVQVLQKAGDIDYMKLSIAAKTDFLLGRRRGTATEAELAELAPRFGWRVTAEEVKEAARYLRKLHLDNLES